jgi:hypothetical protein
VVGVGGVSGGVELSPSVECGVSGTDPPGVRGDFLGDRGALRADRSEGVGDKAVAGAATGAFAFRRGSGLTERSCNEGTGDGFFVGDAGRGAGATIGAIAEGDVCVWASGVPLPDSGPESADRGEGSGSGVVSMGGGESAEVILGRGGGVGDLERTRSGSGEEGRTSPEGRSPDFDLVFLVYCSCIDWTLRFLAARDSPGEVEFALCSEGTIVNSSSSPLSPTFSGVRAETEPERCAALFGDKRSSPPPLDLRELVVELVSEDDSRWDGGRRRSSRICCFTMEKR